MNKSFRQLAINLLDDADGVNQAGYDSLIDFAFTNNVPFDDIQNAVSAVNGRVYLEETHEIKA